MDRERHLEIVLAQLDRLAVIAEVDRQRCQFLAELADELAQFPINKISHLNLYQNSISIFQKLVDLDLYYANRPSHARWRLR